MDKLKYGVIGCAGQMGMAHLLFLNNVVTDRVRVEALCDVDAEQTSACADLFPHEVRISTYILIIATFVTIVDMALHAGYPLVYKEIGNFIPLIVVNCLVLGRAEAFASKNNVVTSAIDALGMGLGFSMALTMLGAIREILGSGSIFGLKLIPGDGMIIFVLAPGAFLALGYLIVLINKINGKKA